MRPGLASWWLGSLFFVSGAAALVFETLWFNRAGLAFGNSVWATSLVLASFMGGLALGNAIAARGASQWRRPLLIYAGLEIVVGLTGFALVCILPGLGARLAPLLRPLLDHAVILNALRFAIAMLLLLVPATAMGATLPVLVRAFRAFDSSFGSTLGKLYGWNTLGAVAGVLAAEGFLIERLGVRDTALFALTLDLVAALGAWVLYERLRARLEAAPIAAAVSITAPPPGARRFLAAAALSGAILLALEVVWFRFMLLFVHSGSLIFAVMLAVVLSGIGVGGFIASLWMRRAPHAYRRAPLVSLAAGICVILLYRVFALAQAHYGSTYILAARSVAWLSLVLMLPGSTLSGMLFTLTGAALHQETTSDTHAAGWLTFSNTLGAMCGALAAGFVAIPVLGMEGSFFVLAVLYGGVALLLAGAPALRRLARQKPRLVFGPAAVFALALACFPFGWMRQRYMQIPVQRWNSGTMQVVQIREGRSETITYLRQDFAGAPEYYKMITNGFSMSGTAPPSRRYMKLYAYFPVALHPKPRRALLISYGVGSTAKALVDTDELERIDVVDISKEILEMSDIVFPNPTQHPLHDPRVHVYVEDGRYFLQSRSQQYDIITGEPPPPKVAGVVNLYTREYFELVRQRLAPGGIHTYWLPVHNLTPADTRAILNAYCDVFPDCSLWAGTGLEWMLMGSRDATGPGSVERFERQWQDRRSGPEMRALGVERPEQLGALFMADAPLIRQWAGTTPPLTDDFPKRLSARAVVPDSVRGFYLDWMRTGPARDRFATSPLVQHLWPESLRDRTLPWFDVQRILNEVAFRVGPRGAPDRYFEDLYTIGGDSLRTLALWHLGINADIVPILARLPASGAGEPKYARERGLIAVANGDFAAAVPLLDQAMAAAPDRFLETCRYYALCMAGRAAEARAAADATLRARPPDEGDRRFWQWAATRLQVSPPDGLQSTAPSPDPRLGSGIRH